MDFERDKPQCKFSIPDRPTVRQQLEYFSKTIAFSDEDLLLRYWRGAVALIQDWSCEIMPDYKADLDTLDNPEQTQVIIWAGVQVRDHMNELENLPKNS